MKNIIKIASVAAVAFALTQTLQAVPITGSVTFFGSVSLDTSSVATATEVTGWHGFNGVGPAFVGSSQGALSAAASAPATFATPWAFGPQAALWSYTALNGDTYTFSLTTITQHQVSGSPSVLLITGNGVIHVTSGSVPYSDTGATWSFSTSDPSAGGVFSLQAASGALPDGGATMMMLGIALTGVTLLKKKFMA